jgi:Pyruvate:ferredoxin oxidoreductase and related 2-oxoacid:ferredoxin oxidoreductases, gamma subunit
MVTNDILIAGIGGQGTVLASRLIAAAALEMGLFVRTSETIGMAQRGGSVVSHVRINSEEKNSIIPFYTADLIIAFDETEALRQIKRLKPNGKLLVNINHMATPPEGLDKFNPIMVDGYTIAEKSGSYKTVNTVLIGAAIKHKLLEFDAELMKEVLRKSVPERYIDLNIKAFENSL